MNDPINELAHRIAAELKLSVPRDFDFSKTHYAAEKRCYLIAEMTRKFWNEHRRINPSANNYQS